MIVVKYDVNTAGVRVEALASGQCFIIRDGQTSFQCDEMKELLDQGSRGGPDGHEIHIPETLETIVLFDIVKARTEWFGPFSMRGITQDDLDQMGGDNDT